MQTGDIVIVNFPFSNLIEEKARPAVVVTITEDGYRDVLVCMISSVVPKTFSKYQLIVQPSKKNNLRAISIIKVSRIVTIENNKVIAEIGKLDKEDLKQFKLTFKSLVDNNAE
ncbi:type II toxin-antitoxin system PemK/MazF family toxin [Parasediminibacterium sp. JCM 36343]|uniref:type II toxin-antitoxin system PemK/MazF family toxin n=1 Tax=Parasediminibacterium sp. JCM 36343 TaxID=3374279 RepID=UPI003978788B